MAALVSIRTRLAVFFFLITLLAIGVVYIGVAPRQIRNGGRQAVAQAWVRWADLDRPADDDLLRLGPHDRRHGERPGQNAARLQEARYRVHQCRDGCVIACDTAFEQHV